MTPNSSVRPMYFPGFGVPFIHMNLTRKIAWTLALGIGGTGAVATSAAIADRTDYQDGPRTVPFTRSAPCAACHTATPVTITCSDGTVWHITRPGTYDEIATAHCEPGPYAWKVNS